MTSMETISTDTTERSTPMLLTGSGMTVQQWTDMATKAYLRNATGRTGHRFATTLHVMAGVYEDHITAAAVISHTNPKSQHLKNKPVFARLAELPVTPPTRLGRDGTFSDGTRTVLSAAAMLAEIYDVKRGTVYTDHLLAALLLVGDDLFDDFMDELDVDREALLRYALGAIGADEETARALRW